MSKIYTHPMMHADHQTRRTERVTLALTFLSLILMAAVLAFLWLAPVPAHADTTAPAARLTSAPACAYEDGSGQRVCVWDGAHAGNGIGRSVVIRHGGTDRGTITYVSHSRAHRLIARWEASR